MPSFLSGSEEVKFLHPLLLIEMEPELIMGMWTIPKPENEEPNYSPEEMQSFIEIFAQNIVKRKMSVPATIAFEIAKPFSTVGSQFLSFLSPFLDILFSETETEKLTLLIAHRSLINKLLMEIENLENKINPENDPDEH